MDVFELTNKKMMQYGVVHLWLIKVVLMIILIGVFNACSSKGCKKSKSVKEESIDERF